MEEWSGWLSIIAKICLKNTLLAITLIANFKNLPPYRNINHHDSIVLYYTGEKIVKIKTR